MFALYLQRQTVSFDVYLEYENSCVNKFILTIVKNALPSDLTPPNYYFEYVTSYGKTYTNAFPLNGLKHWQSIGKALAKGWISVGSPLEVLEKALEGLANPLEVLRKAVEKPVGKVHASHSRC